MNEVFEFLKTCGVYYLATVEGDQPRVRPFGTVNVFDGKLYIQTGKVKEVSKQLHANPKAEICAFAADGRWIRVAGKLISDDRREAKASERQDLPDLQHVVHVVVPVTILLICKSRHEKPILFHTQDGSAADRTGLCYLPYLKVCS